MSTGTKDSAKANGLGDDFEQRLNAVYPGTAGRDQDVMRFAKSWHRYPPLEQALQYRGINLGEMSELSLVQVAISAVVDAAKAPPKP